MSRLEQGRPAPPRKPEPDECCGSGCLVCVFDRYEQELERYREALRAWEAAHPEAGQPTSEPKPGCP